MIAARDARGPFPVPAPPAAPRLCLRIPVRMPWLYAAVCAAVCPGCMWLSVLLYARAYTLLSVLSYAGVPPGGRTLPQRARLMSENGHSVWGRSPIGRETSKKKVLG